MACGSGAGGLAVSRRRAGTAKEAGAKVEQKLTSRSRPESAPLSATPLKHPLNSVITYARGEQEYLQKTLHDFSCRLVKRKRIEGFLQDYEYINMWVREEARQDNRVTQPMSIYLEFLGPQKVAGRRVLFIEGENDGKMMVRNGGKHFDYVTVNIAPDSDSAREESLVPITQSGFNRVLAQMIDVLERHRKADPSGTNTQVKRIVGAKINKRPASVIHIVHPQKQAGLEFHEANVFVDDELRSAGARRLLAMAEPGQPEAAVGRRVYLHRLAAQSELARQHVQPGTAQEFSLTSDGAGALAASRRHQSTHIRRYSRSRFRVKPS